MRAVMSDAQMSDTCVLGALEKKHAAPNQRLVSEFGRHLAAQAPAGRWEVDAAPTWVASRCGSTPGAPMRVCAARRPALGYKMSLAVYQ